VTEERKDSLSDEEFEAYLEGRSRVSRGYRPLQDLEPPPELDHAVLREARVAVAPPARRRHVLPGWLPRIAVAATLLVAVGVALQFGSAPLDTPWTKESTMTDAPVSRSPVPESSRPALITESPQLSSSRIRKQRTAVPASPAGPAAESRSPLLGDQPHLVTKTVPERSPAVEEEAELAAADAGGTGQERTGAAEARRPAAAYLDEQSYQGEEDQLEFYDVLPQASTADETESSPLESALRRRLGAGAVTDDAERARVEERVRRLMTYQRVRSTRITPMMQTLRTEIEPPPRDDWIALIDAQLDVGNETGAWRELLLFVDTWPDYPLDERLRQLLEGGGVVPH
jgi:hypothetical protein